MTTEPQVSVVITSFNCGRFLDDCIRSIVEQTLSDFELVIFDDGSTDNSTEVIRKWASGDARIRLIEQRNHFGSVRSSNLVVQYARAPLIARMDADDIADPNRLKRQVEAMKDPKVALVGTLCDGIDVRGSRVRPRDRWRIVRRSPFAPFPHGSIMYRRSAFDDIGGYCEAEDYGEDADLYLRILAKGKIALLPEVLYHYRYHTSSTTLAVASSKIEAPIGTPPSDVLYTLAAMRLWAGYRPDVLKTVFSGSLRTVNLRTLRTLIFVVCGNVHPRSFRWLLSRGILWRDWFATFWIDESQLYEWRGDQAVKYCES